MSLLSERHEYSGNHSSLNAASEVFSSPKEEVTSSFMKRVNRKSTAKETCKEQEVPLRWRDKRLEMVLVPHRITETHTKKTVKNLGVQVIRH